MCAEKPSAPVDGLPAKGDFYENLTLLLLAALTQLFFPTSTYSQSRNVTFIVRTCTIPDTVGPRYNIQLRGNKPPLTSGNDAGGRMTNIGGDYWLKTLAFNVGDAITMGRRIAARHIAHNVRRRNTR